MTLWRAHAEAGLLAGFCDPMESSQSGAAFFWRTAASFTQWHRPMLEVFMKDRSLWEGVMLEKLMEDCLPGKGLHTGMGEEFADEGAAEAICDELTTTLIPVHLLCLGEGGREAVSEVEPGKKGEVGRRCFQMWVYFSISYSDLIGSKLTSFPWIYSVLPVMIVGEWSASVCFSSQDSFVAFSLPCLAKEGSNGVALVASLSTHHSHKRCN